VICKINYRQVPDVYLKYISWEATYVCGCICVGADKGLCHVQEFFHFCFSVVIPTVARHDGSTLPQAPIPMYLQQPQQSTAFSVASNGYNSTGLSHPGNNIAVIVRTNFCSDVCPFPEPCIRFQYRSHIFVRDGSTHCFP